MINTPIVTAALRDEFLLDPNVVFLNHGSFGACPKPVFETYQRWQLELERQPVEFLGRRADPLLDHARTHIATYLHAPPDSLVFVPNATLGVNTVVRSLTLQAGDEILGTDHEYGAVDKTWEHVCRKTGARYIRQPMPLPFSTPEHFIEQLWQAVTPRTRVIAISHITSPTALIFPIAEVCRRARAAGILTLIDGAHVPGQLDLDLQALDPDFYTGNFHKWLCAPKGSAFLYVRPEHHGLINPLVISWGMADDATFVTRNQWQGTRDLAAFLSVPAAIDFQREHNWPEVRRACHALAVETAQRIDTLTGLSPLAPESWYAQMITAALPAVDPVALKQTLYDEYRIEVPIVFWNGQTMIRVSVQGYNTSADMDHLLDALTKILPTH